MQEFFSPPTNRKVMYLSVTGEVGTVADKNSCREGRLLEVIAFIGPTGTGKSHRASKVAHDCGADVLIDDGILIKDNKIIAGSSAKYETNKIRSVKKAIFIDEEHAQQVRDALNQLQKGVVAEGSDAQAVAAYNLTVKAVETYLKKKDTGGTQ